MANRYWVGGTGNWHDATNHWASSSGGSPNAVNFPTLDDDVHIDANSGFGSGGTITLQGTYNTHVCRDFICNSGHTFTITSLTYQWIYIYGSLTLESMVTWSIYYTNFVDGSSAKTITTDGVTFPNSINFQGSGGGGWTLQDDLVCSGEFQMYGGKFDANDHNVKANYFYFATYETTITLIMGSGVWELTGTGFYLYEYETFTVTCETSTIKFTNAAASAKRFAGAGKTFYKFWITGAGTGSYTISGSNTFNEFKCDTPPHTLIFSGGTTQTISFWNVSGSVGNLITIDGLETGLAINTTTIANGGSGWAVDDWFYITSPGGGDDFWGWVTSETGGVVTGFEVDTAGTGFAVANGVKCIADGGVGTGFLINITAVTASNKEGTLTKSPSGRVISDYLDISNSNANGGKWFAGANSNDTDNNTGWIFRNPKVKGMVGGGVVPFPD